MPKSDPMNDFYKVATRDEIPPGKSKMVEIEDRMIGIFNVDGTFYAIDNGCTHRGGPLSEGHLDGKEVICPWHAWRFDVTSGHCDINPDLSTMTYPVKIDGNEILVSIPE